MPYASRALVLPIARNDDPTISGMHIPMSSTITSPSVFPRFPDGSIRPCVVLFRIAGALSGWEAGGICRIDDGAFHPSYGTTVLFRRKPGRRHGMEWQTAWRSAGSVLPCCPGGDEEDFPELSPVHWDTSLVRSLADYNVSVEAVFVLDDVGHLMDSPGFFRKPSMAGLLGTINLLEVVSRKACAMPGARELWTDGTGRFLPEALSGLLARKFNDGPLEEPSFKGPPAVPFRPSDRHADYLRWNGRGFVGADGDELLAVPGQAEIFALCARDGRRWSFHRCAFQGDGSRLILVRLGLSGGSRMVEGCIDFSVPNARFLDEIDADDPMELPTEPVSGNAGHARATPAVLAGKAFARAFRLTAGRSYPVVEVFREFDRQYCRIRNDHGETLDIDADRITATPTGTWLTE